MWRCSTKSWFIDSGQNSRMEWDFIIIFLGEGNFPLYIFGLWLALGNWNHSKIADKGQEYCIKRSPEHGAQWLGFGWILLFLVGPINLTAIPKLQLPRPMVHFPYLQGRKKKLDRGWLLWLTSLPNPWSIIRWSHIFCLLEPPHSQPLLPTPKATVTKSCHKNYLKSKWFFFHFKNRQ